MICDDNNRSIADIWNVRPRRVELIQSAGKRREWKIEIIWFDLFFLFRALHHLHEAPGSQTSIPPEPIIMNEENETVDVEYYFD